MGKLKRSNKDRVFIQQLGGLWEYKIQEDESSKNITKTLNENMRGLGRPDIHFTEDRKKGIITISAEHYPKWLELKNKSLGREMNLDDKLRKLELNRKICIYNANEGEDLNVTLKSFKRKFKQLGFDLKDVKFEHKMEDRN